jgi:TctA family transporter
LAQEAHTLQHLQLRLHLGTCQVVRIGAVDVVHAGDDDRHLRPAGHRIELGALLIQGIEPGPTLITQHADLFWGLIASFWIGNVLLILLNIPLIGLWVKLLQVPYRFLYPSALLFIAVGVYSVNNSLFEVGEVVVFGIAGAMFAAFDFQVAPILLGFVLGPMVEANFRRAVLLSHGSLLVFVQHPVSAVFVGITAALILLQVGLRARGALLRRPVVAEGEETPALVEITD